MIKQHGHNLIGLLMLGLAMAGVFFVLYGYQHSETKAPEVTQNQKNKYRYPKPSHDIKGFKYEGMVDGQRKIRITADRFSIQKKKMGGLRFGLMQEAVFENAKIHLYGINDAGSDKIRDEGSEGRAQRIAQSADFLSANTLPFLPKKIAGVRLTPAALYLHWEEGSVTGIYGKKAEIQSKEKSLVFTGRSAGAFQDKRISAGRIRFFPEKQMIVADKGVRYYADGKQWKGDHLVTDVFLNIVKRRDRMTAGDR